jgi:hypothetical protein
MNGQCIYDLIDDNVTNGMREQWFLGFSDKYEIPMLKSVVYTCRLHICDMFDKMLVMASRGLVKGLFNYFILHHCFPIILLFSRCHSILGSDLGSGPEKVA